MKTKTFILALMMLFGSMVYGQNNNPDWGEFNYHNYSANMEVIAQVEIDNEVQTSTDIRVAAFCGDERRSDLGQLKTAPGGKTLLQLTVYSEPQTGVTEKINFRLYDGHSMYVSNASVDFVFNGVYGDLINPYTIEFTSVAETGGQKYASLQAAYDAAAENGTITLLNSVAGPGLVIDKNVTIDFAGKTYTFNKAVGSAGTETIGFQILKGNKVTLEGGTLTSTAVVEGKEVKMLIQNYSNLTLTGMNIVDNTNHILYALSNNCGTTDITGATNITTDAVAFDVYDYSSAGYAYPTVNVETTGKITGTIEVSGTISGNLNISGGTFTNKIEEAWCADGYIPVQNADGTWTVKKGEFVAQINEGAKYETLAEAYAAATSGQTITLLKDVTCPGLSINKSITIDLGGFTYTINEAVGSTGTKSQGFQLLMGNTVTIMNGTVAVKQADPATHVVWMFNSYANLTLSNLTVDCEYMDLADPQKKYVVVANNGGGATPTVTMTGVTVTGFDETAHGAPYYVDPGTTLVAGSGLNVETVDGYVVVYADGKYTAVAANVQVKRAGEVVGTYATIASAQNAAQAGDEIVLLNDMTEDVTVNKSVKLDGAGKSYTGTMTLTNKDFEVSNVNFVNGNIYKHKRTGTVDKFIIVDCTFDGGNMNNYAVNVGAINDIKIESCTAKDYGYGFLQISSSNASLSLKEVDIDNVSYGIKVDYSNGVTLENVEMNNIDSYGIYDSNYGTKTYTVNNCDIKLAEQHADNAAPIKIWVRNENNHTTFNFEGETDIHSTEVLSVGDYGIINGSQVGTKIYATLEEAYEVADETNSTVTLLGNETGSGLSINKDVTIDLGGFTYTINEAVGSTGTESQGFQLLKDNEVTIKNGNIAVADTEPATHVVWMFNSYADLTLEDVAVNCTNMDLADPQKKYVVVANNGGGATPTVTMTGVTVTGFDETAHGAPYYVDPGTTLNAPANLNVETMDGYVVVYADGKYTAVAEVAEIVETGETYATLQSAVSAAENGQTVKLLVNVVEKVTVGYAAPQTITIDLNEHTISTNDVTITSYRANTVLTVQNGKVSGNSENGGTVFATYGGTLVLGDDIEVVTGPHADAIVLENGSLRVDDNMNVSVIGAIDCIDATESTNHISIASGYYGGNIKLNSTSTCILTGGTFTQDVDVWCAEGYAAVDNTNGTWTVKPEQSLDLYAGWNWFSSYINISGETGMESLQNALGNNGVQIKNNRGYTDYTDDTDDTDDKWYGSLTEVSVKDMYMIKVKDDQVLQLAGEVVDPSVNSITLAPNWNWIGYQLNEPLLLADALKSITPKHGDRIKSHVGFSQYYTNYGWWGTLSTMTPGYGYMYYNASTATQTLTYSYPTGSKSELKANVTSENNYWAPMSSRYANNMNMIAIVEGNKGADFEVAAFVNGEVRGSARPIYVEPLDAYMLFLTIHGEGVEEMTFQYYDLATGEEYTLGNRMNYSDNAFVGTMDEPYVLTLGTTGIGEAFMSEFNVYPNPTTIGKEVSLGATCETVEIFNAVGVKMAEYHNVDTIDAFETAGVYVIRLTDSGEVRHCRLVVR